VTNYATGTSVNADRSRAEIETTLSRFGASGFGYYTDMTKRIAQIGFTHSGLSIRIEVSLPDLEASRGKPHGVVLAITDGKRG